MNTYEELRVRVSRVGPTRFVVLANGPAAAAGITHIAPDNGFRTAYAALLDEEFRRRPRAETPVHQRVRELGERLFHALFPEPVATCLFESARRAELHGRYLRVRFELPSALADLPVEVLHPPLPYRRLTGDTRFSLTRSLRGAGLSPGRLPTAASRPARFRVLVVVADHPDLNLGAEVLALQETLSAGSRPAAVMQEFLGGPNGKRRPTLANLRSALTRHAEMPTAVVLLGHGTGGRVVLENKDGTPDPVAGERFAAELAAAPNVRLVVLNLCAGAEGTPAAPAVADELIARGIPAVVAMQADVSNTAAARFTPSLFSAIAANGSLDEAVSVARNDMVNPLDETTLEWATPVLFLHQQCRHTWLFKTVKVVERGVVPADPLARGQAAMAHVDNPSEGVVEVDVLEEAARCSRLHGDWRRVVRYADLGRDDHPEPLEWLAQEGRLELAVDRWRMICEQLARQDDAGVALELVESARAALPEQVFETLAGEVHLAAKASTALSSARQAADIADWDAVVAYCDEIIADLPDGYGDAVALRTRAVDELDLAVLLRRADDYRDAGDWNAAGAAYAAITHRRPDGYCEAAAWRDYATGRLRELGNDPAGAVEAYDEAGEIADARGRAALCRGHHAGSSGEERPWAEAVTWYETAAEHGVDPGLALPYAKGRAAAERGDFAEAADTFRALPDQYRDVRVHARFAEGKVAFDAAQWPAVLDALHVLPPGFHHGDVSRMRGLARARIAQQRADWQAVVEALQGVEDDDEIVTLRASAQAKAAEARGDYEAVAVAFRKADLPDLDHLRLYAEGRISEKRGDLAAASAAYDQLPDTVKDVPKRRNLVRGMLAEAQGDWPEAERRYRELPAEYGATRARYAAVRVAADAGDWAAVVSVAEDLDDFRDAQALAQYGKARTEESTEDWAAAAELYRRCTHADSAERHDYARGRALTNEGRWEEALRAFEPLPDDHRDVTARRRTLSALLASFGWTQGLGETPLVPDPSAVASPDFPYRVLAPLGIGPGASMQEIKDAEMRAMREMRGNVAATIGVAKTFRSWDTRLAVDADLYPIRDADALRRAFGTMTEGEPADLFDRLCAEAPADAPLLTLLHVGREQAINAWEERLRADPTDLVTVHCLAIAHRWSARDLDRAEAWEHGREAWQRCIGMWVTALGDEKYWERWRQERSARYRFMVPVAEIRSLRRTMLGDVTDELHSTAERHDGEGRPALAAHYRALGLAVRVETLGRDVLAELRETRPTEVFGGPAFQRVAGLSGALAKLAADVVRESEMDDELTVRLCAAFSRLAPARALLEDGRPERALAVLPDQPRTRFADAARGCTCTEELCAACQRFLDDDPAYLHLGGREARLWQDSVRIAIRCHTEVARASAMGDDESGVDTAVRAITKAVELAGGVGLAARARREVAELVDSTVEAMTGPRAQRPQRALELVERVREVPRLRSDDLLRRAHAEALYQHAQAIMLEYTESGYDYDRAIADLRQAIELNPAVMMARVGLAHTLVQRSQDMVWVVSHARPLAEALTVVIDGLRAAPGMIQLHEALTVTADQVRSVIYGTMTPEELMELQPGEHRADESRAQSAIRLARAAMRAPDTKTALLLAVDGVVADPKETLAQQTLLDLVRRWAESEGSTP